MLLGAGTAAAVAGLLFHAVLLVPLYVGGHPHGRPDLVVMTANLRLGQADPATVVALVRKDHVDVLVLEEVTPEAAAALAAAGLRTVLGHVVGTAAPGAAGTLVLSRYPLTGTTPLATGNASYRTRVGAPRPFWLLAIHPSQPLREDGAWSRDWAVLEPAIASLRGPRLVVGDFNAVLDHAPVRAALETGLRDAAEQADSGWQPTWPSRATGHRFLLGLVLFPIDHVLASGHFAAVSTSTYDVPGTDHRALVARLAAVPG
jgi:endonuclease/exonuclease/phosphatase (EEP) superfamily protein YafD